MAPPGTSPVPTIVIADHPHHRVPLIAMLLTTVLLIAMLFATVLAAPPVAADPVRPGGTESVIDDVHPAAPGVTVEVLGGDSFLQVTAKRGTQVVVPGYQGEPYLRIRADGVVERNVNSPSVALNQSRLGTVPQGGSGSKADATATPRWKPTGGRGRVAWHDHRIHWMVPTDPVAAHDGVIQPWEVPLEVDGRRVTVSGRLLLVDAGFPWALVVLLAVGGAVAVWGLRDGRQLVLLGGAVVVAASVGLASWRANPPEAGARPWLVALAAAAGAAVVVAAVLRRGARRERARSALVAAVALLAGWSAYQATALWSAVLPTTGPGWVDRLGTAVVSGVVVGVAVALVRPPRTDRPRDVRAAGS